MKKNNCYENYVKELKNSKYHFVEIDEKNIKEIKYEDVAFYKEAEGGAMGEPGGVEIVMQNGKFYHTNIGMKNTVFNNLLKNLFPFENLELCLEFASNVPKNFKWYNLGYGNYLFVNQKIVKNFEKMIKNIQKNSEIYIKWKDFAMEILKNYNSNKTKQDSSAKYILHKKPINEVTEKEYKKVLELPDDVFVDEKEKQLANEQKNNIQDIEKSHQNQKSILLTEQEKPITKMEVEHILKEKANREGIKPFLEYINASDVLSGSMLQRYLRIGFSAAYKILDYLVQIQAIEPFDGTAKPRQILDKEKLIKVLS